MANRNNRADLAVGICKTSNPDSGRRCINLPGHPTPHCVRRESNIVYKNTIPSLDDRFVHWQRDAPPVPDVPAGLANRSTLVQAALAGAPFPRSGESAENPFKGHPHRYETTPVVSSDQIAAVRVRHTTRYEHNLPIAVADVGLLLTALSQRVELETGALDQMVSAFITITGHTEHCAKRLAWGDGRCSCDVGLPGGAG